MGSYREMPDIAIAIMEKDNNLIVHQKLISNPVSNFKKFTLRIFLPTTCQQTTGIFNILIYLTPLFYAYTPIHRLIRDAYTREIIASQSCVITFWLESSWDNHNIIMPWGEGRERERKRVRGGIWIGLTIYFLIKVGVGSNSIIVHL